MEALVNLDCRTFTGQLNPMSASAPACREAIPALRSVEEQRECIYWNRAIVVRFLRRPLEYLMEASEWFPTIQRH